MEQPNYPDPLAHAAGRAAQRSAQFASIVMTAGQVFAWYRAQREQEQAAAGEQAVREAREQQRAAYQRGRLGWAPALDPQWLGQADLLQTARAWGAAAPFADTDPAAASALRACEERLRRLHPYAMAYYDRLRGDGFGPIDAMRQTVPLFTREPNVRTGDAGPSRSALQGVAETGAHNQREEAAAARPRLPGAAPAEGKAGPDEPAERRGRQIVEQLQAQARASGRSALTPDELAIVLETVTNLPEHIITKLTVVSDGALTGRTATQVAAESFPFSASEVAATAHTSSLAKAPSSTRSVAVHQVKRPGRSV